jgi:hypothetical protein
MRVVVRKWGLPAVLLLGACVALPLLRGQDKTAPPGEQSPRPYYFSSNSCQGCHLNQKFEDRQLPYLCEGNEMKVWADHNHATAFRSLIGDKAQEMGKRLPRLVPLEQAAACVNCHSVPHDSERNHDRGFQRHEEGVTCAICHGAAEKWVAAHHGNFQNLPRANWRALTRADRERDAGMIDLWNPVRRAEVCLSCHVGDAAKGRVVTHEMYAAGHPPLPGFELATFSRKLPQHWKLLREKQPRDMTLNVYQVSSVEIDYEETRLVLAGALVTLRESMQLLAHLASEPPIHGHKAEWPDLAQFDCYACHHDLKPGGWRLDPNRPGRSGRPPMREWPTVLARAGLRALGEDTAQLDAELVLVRQGFGAQPFGQPAEIHAAAASTARWLISRPPLGKSAVNGPVARRFLEEICTVATAMPHDYDSMRQLGWAVRIVFQETFPDAPLPDALSELERRLLLQASPADQRASRDSKRAFANLYTYEPKPIQDLFARLRQALPPSR